MATAANTASSPSGAGARDESSRNEQQPSRTSQRDGSGQNGEGDAFGSSNSRPVGRHRGRAPKGYRRSDDQVIEEAQRKLEDDDHVDASEIEVLCEKSVLNLRGSVEDRRSKRAAEECVEHIFGVKDVQNELRVDEGFFARLFGSSGDSERKDRDG